MSQSRLIDLSYYDPKAEVRLTAYADTLVLDESKGERTMTAIRFGGYPEMVNAMAAAMHGGASIEATVRDESIRFLSLPAGAYRVPLPRGYGQGFPTTMWRSSFRRRKTTVGQAPP